MTKASKASIDHPHLKEWDHHGSYQWTYFDESIKQKISFFLAKRLSGKNLDLGGGWYLTHPGSTAVDLSSVCLDYNMATEKVQFDLETLAKGRRLPFPQHSFNSATMVSAWQYIKHSDALVRELGRVLRPGAELYIINGQGAGLSECIQSHATSGPISHYFKEKGFDTLVEDIPCSILEPNKFQSVCIAFPEQTLFGGESRIKNRARRMKENREMSNNPRQFLQDFANYQVSVEVAGLRQLATHPVTQHSRDFLNRVEEFGAEYKKRTGNVAIVYTEHTIEPAINMMLADERTDLFCPHLFTFAEGQASDEVVARFKLPASRYIGYFRDSCPDRVLERCGKIQDVGDGSHDIQRLATFASSIGLNEDTRELQQGIYTILSSRFGKKFEGIMNRERAFALHMSAYESKQRRKTDEFIARKKQILEGGVPIVGEATFDFARYIPLMAQFHPTRYDSSVGGDD